MRNGMNNSKIYGRARIAFFATAAALAALIVALVVSILTLGTKKPTVAAASPNTVTIHVYDSNQEYSKIAAWVWIDGEEGRDFTLQANSSEEFKKSYTLNGSEVVNAAYTVSVPLSDVQVTKLKGGTRLGILICAPTGQSSSKFWDKYKTETSDVFVVVSDLFDQNNSADVYYIRKEKTAYTNLEDAKMALEKVTNARFKSKTVVEFETTSPITNGMRVTLSDGTNEYTSTATKDSSSAFTGTASFAALSSAFDFSANYTVHVGDIPTGASVAKTSLLDEADFIKTFETQMAQSLEYGAIYTKEKTTFRVWAPFASYVNVKIYPDGSNSGSTNTLAMSKKLEPGGSWSGVWEFEYTGDHHGEYYTYMVNNYGAVTETIDPYAKACGVDGERGMIVDLDSTDPDGWANDKHLASMNAANADVPIVWELHVSDFSASPDSGMTYKGKYLAFTETGTKVPGTTLKTGIDYLKDLGVTYVQLNPVYDFSSVNESNMSVADNTKDNFNWGYDPENYNIPEGSYSTDPYHGEVRIKEFKQMIMALHKAGIGVIMDVVYNHTYSTGGQALHDTVPYYYHRTTTDGSFSNDSGCGNETASERAMYRKYMVDSVLYWANEYHIDGFRFDLMGLHDTVTINKIREKLDTVKDGATTIGSKILMYGEPWAAGNSTPASYTARVNSTKSAIAGTGEYTSNGTSNSLIKNGYSTGGVKKLNNRVAVFGDSGRDGLRGNNDPGSGWANGAASDENVNKVKRMIEGGCGTSGAGVQTNAGSQLIAYASAHDNYTLWDQLMGKQAGKETPLYYSNYIADNAKKCEVIAAACLTSSGIPFMLAGEEMGRTKYGNHNSYNSSSKVNQIVWSRQQEFKPMVDSYKAMIALRKKHPEIFGYTKSQTASNCYCSFGGSDGVITYTRGGMTCSLNGNTGSVSITIGSDSYSN